ncbi:hypothetical protein BS78_08G076800 [Paspalum vaginatum]|nr:hypothetical protein BS78_08G076800 [Paspalum vaginatum]
MHDTLGYDGSGVWYPDRLLLLLPPPPPRLSGGTMGPEKALRWLKEDLPPLPLSWGGKVEEKDPMVGPKKVARLPPVNVRLLDLACYCFLCFFSIRDLASCGG